MAPSTDPSAALMAYVETWHDAAGRLTALARELPEDRWHLPTDLEGWDVQDNVAHTAHLEAVLAGAPEETIAVAEAPHLRGLLNYYTEQGVLARRGRTMAEVCDELDDAVGRRYDALLADPPTDPSAPAPKTPGDIGWSHGTLLSNRPLDVWMHEQDVRRAVGVPGGYDAPAAAHVIDVFGRGLGLVWGKRAAAGVGRSLVVELTDRRERFRVVVGEDGRAVPDPGTDAATTTLRMSAEAFVVLAGGRRTPGPDEVSVEGDRELGERTLASLRLTP